MAPFSSVFLGVWGVFVIVLIQGIATTLPEKHQWFLTRRRVVVVFYLDGRADVAWPLLFWLEEKCIMETSGSLFGEVWPNILAT